MRIVVLLCGLCAAGCGVRVVTYPATEKKGEPSRKEDGGTTVDPKKPASPLAKFSHSDSGSSMRWLALQACPLLAAPIENPVAQQLATERFVKTVTEAIDGRELHWQVRVAGFNGEQPIPADYREVLTVGGVEKVVYVTLFTSLQRPNHSSDLAYRQFIASLKIGSPATLVGTVRKIDVGRSPPNEFVHEDRVDITLVFEPVPQIKPAQESK